jgi:hypothetical protein
MRDALRPGIPQVIIPLAHDQFDNASRLTRLGVAETVDLKRVSEKSLSASLHRLLIRRRHTRTAFRTPPNCGNPMLCFGLRKSSNRFWRLTEGGDVLNKARGPVPPVLADWARRR